MVLLPLAVLEFLLCVSNEADKDDDDDADAASKWAATKGNSMGYSCACLR